MQIVKMNGKNVVLETRAEYDAYARYLDEENLKLRLRYEQLDEEQRQREAVIGLVFLIIFVGYAILMQGYLI